MENDCHGECFDYFVPANENGNKLAQTFIIDGVGRDLYPEKTLCLNKSKEFEKYFKYKSTVLIEITSHAKLWNKNRREFLDIDKQEAYRIG